MMLISLLSGAIAMGVVYLFGCLGETLIEKVGNLNLGIPGIMAFGALGGSIGVYLAYKMSATPIGFIVVLFGLIFSFVFAAFGGLIYAFLTVSLQANQNVTGLVLTTFGVGFMKFIGRIIPDQKTIFPKASLFFKNLFPFSEKLGWFGKLFMSYGFLVYLALIIALLLWFFLNKTKKGLFLRSIGESPQTADAQGINVTRYKYIAILIGSGIAGLSGLYYVFDRSGGTTFTDADIEGFGWLAVALVIFSMWKPGIGVIGSFIFGALYILPNYVNVSNITLKIFIMFPYLATVIVLILNSILNSKNFNPPQALGINYFREER